MEQNRTMIETYLMGELLIFRVNLKITKNK